MKFLAISYDKLKRDLTTKCGDERRAILQLFINCLVVNCILCTCTTIGFSFSIDTWKLWFMHGSCMNLAWFLHESCMKFGIHTIHACMVHAWFIHSINHACHMHVTWHALFMHVICMINVPISHLFHVCLHVSCVYVVHAWNMHGKAWMNCAEKHQTSQVTRLSWVGPAFSTQLPQQNIRCRGLCPHNRPQSWQWHSKPPLLDTVYSQIETTAARYHNHCPGQLILSVAACHKDPGARVSSLATLRPRSKLSRPI